jgi:hypothetical protein
MSGAILRALDIEPTHSVIATTRPGILPVFQGKITKRGKIGPQGRGYVSCGPDRDQVVGPQLRLP